MAGVHVGAYIPQVLAFAIKKISLDDDRSLSNVIAIALRAYVDQKMPGYLTNDGRLSAVEHRPNRANGTVEAPKPSSNTLPNDYGIVLPEDF